MTDRERNSIIDECISEIKIGMSRDGHHTSHYQQSVKHILALENMKHHGIGGGDE